MGFFGSFVAIRSELMSTDHNGANAHKPVQNITMWKRIRNYKQQLVQINSNDWSEFLCKIWGTSSMKLIKYKSSESNKT